MTPETKIILNVNDKEFSQKLKQHSTVLCGTIGSDTYTYSSSRY